MPGFGNSDRLTRRFRISLFASPKRGAQCFRAACIEGGGLSSRAAACFGREAASPQRCRSIDAESPVAPLTWRSGEFARRPVSFF